jgi:hypothetical protein
MTVTLNVSKFSCIEKAQIEIFPLTVIIGPQASGKSVVSKLNFFFVNLWAEQFSALEDGKDIDGFKEIVKEKFNQYFPCPAWGGSKFSIDFAAGKWGIKITRLSRKGVVKDDLRITFSAFFTSHFETISKRYKTVRKKSSDSVEFDMMDLSWEIRESSEKILTKELGRDFFPFQLFIPAGRSFFTNAGKAVTLLEQGNMVDPFIARFGRYYASARDRLIFTRRTETSVAQKTFDTLTRELLGGTPKRERSLEYLESKDGRKIPFMVMSSGQQELMPLVMALKSWSPFSRRRTGSILYIEEPEAHLFPSGQSKFVELIALLMGESATRRNAVFITTHSPYVLAKLNNLIKAGQLASSTPTAAKDIEKIIPKHAWMMPGDVRCYGMDNGTLHDITDESGLIDAEYLDGVSGTISEEFNKLLAAEFRDVKGLSRG